MQKQFPVERFQIITATITYLTAAFILATLMIVLAKGLPHIGKSLVSAEIQFAIKLSLYTSIISTMLCLIIAIPVAYSLARVEFPLKGILNTLLDIPLALPHIVSGFCLLLLFGSTAFGGWLERLGLSFVFTTKGIITAQLFVNLPYMTRVLHSTILSVDRRLEFVARTLGCTPFAAFLKVTLPLSRNGLIAGTVTTWTRALGEFGGALMIAGATRFRTETLPVSLFLNLSTGDLDAAMAVADLLIIISVISLYIFNKLGGKHIGNTGNF